jgi:hypothetical protein
MFNQRILFILVASLAMACVEPPQTRLERLSEARRLNAELLVQFTKAADAANRTVMAGTEEASVASIREAEEATKAVETGMHDLKAFLLDLRYSKEVQLLEEFGGRFAEYRALEQNILEMVKDSSNLKAQRLSFGPAQQEADAFRDALSAIMPATNAARVEALAATALSSVREVQALQAPHIAEPEDQEMTRIEQRMAAAETTARQALKTLTGVVPASARPRVEAASAALDRFVDLNANILALSRRNSNVHALALSLGKKRTLVAACEETLRALQGELSKRGFIGTR